MSLPDDVEALKALVISTTQRADEAEARLANAQAKASATDALIVHLKLQIAKLKREQYGASAERSRRLLDQVELQLEELEADASEDDLLAEQAAARLQALRHSSASNRPESHFPSICRASASSFLRHVPVHHAVACACRSLART